MPQVFLVEQTIAQSQNVIVTSVIYSAINISGAWSPNDWLDFSLLNLYSPDCYRLSLVHRPRHIRRRQNNNPREGLRYIQYNGSVSCTFAPNDTGCATWTTGSQPTFDPRWRSRPMGLESFLVRVLWCQEIFMTMCDSISFETADLLCYEWGQWKAMHIIGVQHWKGRLVFRRKAAAGGLYWESVVPLAIKQHAEICITRRTWVPIVFFCDGLERISGEGEWYMTHLGDEKNGVELSVAWSPTPR